MARLELRTGSAESTREVGSALAGSLRRGDAVILTGELGAGKTTLVQGVARGLDIDDPVVSPTFTLVREYEGRLPVAHVDVYRLERVQDVVDLGLEELGTGDDVLLVEWGDVIEELLPADRLRIELTVADETDDRRIVVSATGWSWADRWGELETALIPWLPGA
jgi:tRNA threonylcarbamoyladenosine biosynthesis protein TsaE